MFKTINHPEQLSQLKGTAVIVALEPGTSQYQTWMRGRDLGIDSYWLKWSGVGILVKPFTENWCLTGKKREGKM